MTRISDTRDKAASLFIALLAPPRAQTREAADQRAHDADERRHRRGGHAPSRSSSGRWARDEDLLYWWPLSREP